MAIQQKFGSSNNSVRFILRISRLSLIRRFFGHVNQAFHTRNRAKGPHSQFYLTLDPKHKHTVTVFYSFEVTIWCCTYSTQMKKKKFLKFISYFLRFIDFENEYLFFFNWKVVKLICPIFIQYSILSLLNLFFYKKKSD